MSDKQKITHVIRKKHFSTIRNFIYPVVRWCPWGKWNSDGTILMNPKDEPIHPKPPIKLDK